jgi:hypothetical protein
VENGSVVFHSGGSFHRQCGTRAAKVTDDTGRFDDESR